MPNELATVKYHPQLPAFLQDPSLFKSSEAMVAGISSGTPPSISVRASKWRLVVGGEEQLVQQLNLDVIVLDGNPHVSKTYYAEAYNDSQEAKPPTCFSDNGIAPSVEAGAPQSVLCASCQFAAFGSKISDNGSRGKACGDSKKLAVVLATDTPVLINGVASVAKAYEQVFLLRVPTMSMGNWKVAAKGCFDRGVPVQGVVMRMTFDSETSYPAILFAAAAFVKEEQVFRHLQAKAATDEVRSAIGANDRPRQAAPALAAPPAFMQPTLAPVPAAAPTPPQAVLQPAFVPPLPQAPTPMPAAPAPETAGRRRGRPPLQATPPDALAMAPAAPQPAPAAVIVQPQAASSDLDALLAKAMS